MAFNSTSGRAEYTATSEQTVFPFLFKIFTDTDIEVYKTPSGSTPDDTADLLTLTIDYTVSINGDDGGDITLELGATAGDTIVLKRNLPILRDIEYQTSGDLLASTLNTDQEYQTYLVLDGDTNDERSIRLPATDTSMMPVLPATQAGQGLFVNQAGTAFEYRPADAIGSTLQAYESKASQLTSKSYATESGLAFVKTYTSDGDGTFTATDTTDFSSYHWSKESEAEALTAASYAAEAEDVEVKVYSSDGDGTFTAIPQAGIYSALHWANKLSIGVPAWSSVITYDIGSRLYGDRATGTDGMVYSSAVDSNLNNDPVGDLTNWLSDFSLYSIREATHNITVDADYTLTDAQNFYKRIVITDTNPFLTTGRNIIVNNIEREFTFVNSTLQILTVKTSLGTGIAVNPGGVLRLRCDGTNVVLEENGIGYDQTWQSLTGSRTPGVTYTNTTGKPIIVSVSISTTTTASARMFVDGTVRYRGDFQTSAGNVCSVVGIIPNGSTYSASVTGGTPTLTAWDELR